MPVPFPHPAARQRGAAMAAFALTAAPLLFCALFAVEAARWHITRQMLNLALLEAARAGATAHGRPSAIERAFETALLPLFQPPGPYDGPRARMRASFLAVTQQTGAPPWRIDVLSPTAAAYLDFADAALRVADAPGRPAINNDYQAEQHLRRRMGWLGGRGPRSGQTVFEANTLRLRLAYAHPPWVPGLRALLRQLAAMRGGRDPAARAGMLVMAMEIALPMQSHPVQWRAAGDGRLSRERKRAVPAWTGGAGSGNARDTDSATPLAALREDAGTRHAAQGEDHGMGSADGASHAAMGNLRPGPEARVGQAAADATDVVADNEACGIVLCCAARSSAQTHARSP